MSGSKDTSKTRISYKCLRGESSQKFAPQIAKLRTELYQNFPYLYKGNEKQEEKYLEKFLEATNAFIVLALHQDSVVGIATALPLVDAYEECQQAFLSKGYAIDKLYYLADFLVQTEFQSKGIGKEFFRLCENEANQSSFTSNVFMCVQRDKNDSRQPKDYIEHSKIFKACGYDNIEGVSCEFSWPQWPSGEETTNTMTFWQKEMIA